MPLSNLGLLLGENTTLLGSARRRLLLHLCTWPGPPLPPRRRPSPRRDVGGGDKAEEAMKSGAGGPLRLGTG